MSFAGFAAPWCKCFCVFHIEVHHCTKILKMTPVFPEDNQCCLWSLCQRKHYSIFFCWNLCKCFEICAYIYWSQQRTVFKQPLLPHSIASERSEQAFHFDQPFLLPGTFHWQWVCIPCCHGNRQIWLADPRELLEFLIKWLSGFFSFWWYCCLTAGIQPHKDPLITVAISLRHVLMAIQSWMC